MNNCIYNVMTVAFLVLKHGEKIRQEHKKGSSSEAMYKHAQNFADEIVERFKINIRTYGLEDLIEGPAIICPSHTSIIDMPSIVHALPGRKYFVGKKEVFKIPYLGNRVKEIGMWEIDRSNREQAIKSLNGAAEMVKLESYGKKKENTAYLLIYPEGTRTRGSDYNLLPFKKGAFHLSFGSGLPIIPVSSFGGIDLMPKGSLRFPDEKERNYYLKVHSPLFPKDFENAGKILEATRLEMELGIKFLKKISRDYN